MLDVAHASHLAKLALACVQREVPHKLDHLVRDTGPTPSPRELHPAFYGCFDWHSAVHGHWMLARLARVVPDLPETAEINAVLDANLSPANLAIEAEYCAARPLFERTYGWAWLLELARELRGTRWAAAVQPLAGVLVGHYLAFLPKQTYPIRSGMHSNTAFGLALALDYARDVGHAELAELIENRARTYYAADVDAPAVWEPSGDDFLSPCLVEADLMRRVLAPARFAAWLHAFLPRLPVNLAEPAIVSDRTDGKLAHLDGLNVSRAWCMRGIAAALSPHDLLTDALVAAADRHAQEGLANVATGDYMGEHWLASFAVYLETGPKSP
jgi:hypothetical protein